tara:strand:- start:13304 stop:18346 length:5043 start_codon:yes stop_codon:yes gene_type:complete
MIFYLQQYKGLVIRMSKKFRSVFLVLIMILSSASLMFIPTASSGSVVISESIEIVDDSAINLRMPTVASDSKGNVHIVWSENTNHLYYKLMDARGNVLIDATRISNAGQVKSWHPDIAVDSNDFVHIVWADKGGGQQSIKYTALNPSMDDQDGSEAFDNVISIIDDTIVTKREKNRDWPAVAVDSMGGVHITWEDSYDVLDKFYAQPQIYYSMLLPDFPMNRAEIKIGDTLITPIIGHKGHPDIAVDGQDKVQIVWDDTRGGKVELVFLIDTSGSMSNEWADVCSVVYGGNIGGGQFEGIKPMLEKANMTVFETIYGLYTSWGAPSAMQSGNCAPHYKNGAGPRATHLGGADGEDSGGIRWVNDAIYNGGTYITAEGEDWGPGSTWACLSWRDNAGNVPGDPPTAEDHQWNPNATKIIMPVSDEGPFNGDEGSQAQYTTTINEAHDSCVNAGIIPVGLVGDGWGNTKDNFQDLSYCPDSDTSDTSIGACPGTSVRTTDAGGAVYDFPASNTGNQMQLLIDALVFVATNNSREIYTTVLDPWGKLNNNLDPNWQVGDSATTASNGRYTEDIGRGEEGHLVVVNDTRITNDDAFSLHPSIAFDSQQNAHVTWMDTRDHGFKKDDNYEIYYSKLRMRGVGDWDGVPEGLSTYQIKRIDDTRISDIGIETQGRPWGPSSTHPVIIVDQLDNAHLAWLDNENISAGEEIQYTRLNATDETGAGKLVLDPWETSELTKWNSDKLGPNSGRTPDQGTPPGFANDLGNGAHLVWSDTNTCNEESNNYIYTICYSHVLTGIVDINFQPGETYFHEIEPGEQTMYNLTVNNSTPGPSEIVADTYRITLEGVPLDWSATLYFSSNNTAIFDDTNIYLAGGDTVDIFMRVRAPNIYQAAGLQDQFANISVVATSIKDPAIRSSKLTITLMDIEYGIDLDASHSLVEVEQGKTAKFSITITNTGNVFDTFAFYDPQTIEGGAAWNLPFGWGVTFPLNVSLDPQQSVTESLSISIPASQNPTDEAINLHGWSTGEDPLRLSPNRGNWDTLVLKIFVELRTTGNIDLNPEETSKTINPGECAKYNIDVSKNYQDGKLVFTLPDAPNKMPDGADPNEWAENNWRVTVDFEEFNAPLGNDVDLSTPRPWIVGRTETIVVEICAPSNFDFASAGLGPSITIKAHLDGFPRVSDSVILSTRVNSIYDLQSTVNLTSYEVDPGEAVIVPMSVKNHGNTPDRYDLRLLSLKNSTDVNQLWDIFVPRSPDLLYPTENGLQRNDLQNLEIIANIPDKVEAGTYVMELGLFSEEAYQGPSDSEKTHLRELITVEFIVREFYDMQISIDPTVENSVKTAAPGRAVQFIVNVTNNGNVVDDAFLNVHVTKEGKLSESAGFGTLLDTWSIRWSELENFGSSTSSVKECNEANQISEVTEKGRCHYVENGGVWMIPSMDAYEVITLVVSIDVGPDAPLTDQELGLKVTTPVGSSEEGGDYDETPTWDDALADSNEQVIMLRLRASNLNLVEVNPPPSTEGSVGDTIPISIKITNDGNAQADNVEVIMCQDQSESDVKENGCDEDNIVFRQVLGAIREPGDDGVLLFVEITLQYPIEAGYHDVVIIIDPNNEIIEINEQDNIRAVGDLSSSNPMIDVAAEVLSVWALPIGVLTLTTSLLGVVYLVGRARRAEALGRVAEQSVLLGENEI